MPEKRQLSGFSGEPNFPSLFSTTMTDEKLNRPQGFPEGGVLNKGSGELVDELLIPLDNTKKMDNLMCKHWHHCLPNKASKHIEMTISSARFEVVKFDGTGNFKLWQTRVKDLLAQEGTLKALQPQKIAGMDDEDWKELQQRATATIRFCLVDEIMHHVMNLESPIEEWNKLESEFMSKSLRNKFYLKMRLYSLKMRENSDLAQHLNVFNQIITDLMQFDVKFNEEDKSIIFLSSLPASYEYDLTTLAFGKEAIKFEEIILVLFAQNQRKHNNGESSHGIYRRNGGSGKQNFISKGKKCNA